LKIIKIILATLFIWACDKQVQNQNFDQITKKKEYTALMFMAPDCPLCMKLATPFSALSDSFPNVQFLAVYSGIYYDPMEINMFATETQLKLPIFRDYHYEVAHQLNAGITPEFFLLDSNSNVLYQGMLDDRTEVIGTYKQTWSHHYLRDAIKASLAKNPIRVKKTDAVGCVLEY
jgi:thiol-disulfide isomerase/thioredoxin